MDETLAISKQKKQQVFKTKLLALLAKREIAEADFLLIIETESKSSLAIWKNLFGKKWN